MKYHIEIGSPPDYEQLVAYIIFDNKHEIVLVSQDEGPDNLKIEFLEGSKLLKIDYGLLLDALQVAKQKLVPS
jgi:hypothetical protein